MDSFLEEPRKTPKPTPVIQEIQSPTVPEVSLMFQNLRKGKSTPINVGKPVQSYNAWKLRSQPKNPQEFDSFLLTANKENTGILQNGPQDRSFLSKKQVRFQSPVQKSPTTVSKNIEHLLPPSTTKVAENAAYLASYYSGNQIKKSEIFSKINGIITVNPNNESPSESLKKSNTSSALLSTKNMKESGRTDKMKNPEISNNPYSLTKPFEQLYVSNLPNRELDLSFLEPQKNPCPRQEFFKKMYTASPDKNAHYSEYYKTITPSFDQPNIQVNPILEMNQYDTPLQPQKEIVDFSNSCNTAVTSDENNKNIENTMNNGEKIEECTNKNLANKDCDKLESDSPSVKDLLTIIKLQNQQLQKLQSQVEKLVQINEIHQLEKQPTPLETTTTRNVVETSFQEQIEQHKHSNDQQNINNKISVGLMTSFEVSFKPPPVKKNKKGRNLPSVQDIRYLQSIKQACYPQPRQDRQYYQPSQNQEPVRYPHSGQEVRYVQTAQQIQYSQPAQKVRYPSTQGIRYQQTTQEKMFSQPVQQGPYFQPTQKNLYPQQSSYSEDSDERQYYQPTDTRPLFTEPIPERPSSQLGQERPYVQPPHERIYVQPAQERQSSQPIQERPYLQPAQERRNQQCGKGMQYQQLNPDVIYAHPAPENMFLEQPKGIQGYEEDIQYKQQDQDIQYQNPVQDTRYRQSAKNIRFTEPSEPVHNVFIQRDKVQENARIRPQIQKEIGEEVNLQNEQQYPQVWNKRKPNETEYSLGSRESLEIQDPPESPENSIHIDIQEYDTESDDSDDECSTEPGWTFYKDILGQVNNILENSSKRSYKPSRNPNKRYSRNKKTDNTLEMIKNNAIQRLQNDGFLNTDDNVDIKPNEISFAVKQILMKYLPDQGLADVANFQDERFNGNNRKPNDLSITTVKYMQQCNVVSNAPPCYDRQLQPEHTNRIKTKNYHQQKSKILDITTLKQQPKLL